ncbi:hypothetical protein [Sphingomonas sp. PB4P5]|uniref:hypothetical protein n=1 Tax=Parasphingomonas puruogangriensis TaxID=3096155 RepID=UPI002FCCA582
MATYRRSILFRLGSDPAAYLWSGVGDLELPINALDGTPTIYRGAGALLDIPELEQLINGAADRIDISISGVSVEGIRLALEDAPSVKGASVHIGAAYFDKHWQLIEVEWLALLRADTLLVAGQQTETGRSRTVTLSIGTDFTDRSRAPVAFFTDPDQRRRSSDDRIFDHVSGITQGTSRKFGPTDA